MAKRNEFFSKKLPEMEETVSEIPEWIPSNAEISNTKLKLLKDAQKDTYLLSNDNIKCLICNKTSWIVINIMYRYCMYCDVYHEGENFKDSSFRKI